MVQSYNFFSCTSENIPALLIGGLLIAAAIFDYLYFRLPDILTFGSGALAIFLIGHSQGFWLPLSGAAMGYGLLKLFQIGYSHFSGKLVLGSGDAKLMIPIGAVLGPGQVVYALIVGTALAMAWTVFRKDRGYIPFGPFLVLSYMLFATMSVSRIVYTSGV